MVRKHLSLAEKLLRKKIYNYLKTEAKSGRPRVKITDYTKRTLDIFRIPESTLQKIISHDKKEKRIFNTEED